VSDVTSVQQLAVALFDAQGNFIKDIPYALLGVGTKNLWLQGLSVGGFEPGVDCYARILKDGIIVKEWLIEVAG
jgi:hypothetical protein